MMIRHFRKITILMSILMIVLVACGPQETETPEPTDVPPTEEAVVEPTDEPTEVPTDEPTEVPTDEPTEVPTDEPTEVPTDEPTEVPTDEPTEAPTEAPTEVVVEETEEATDMSDDSEDMDEDSDMSDVVVATYDDGAGFTFDYPEGYEVETSANGISLAMGDQNLIVISPDGWNAVVVGERTGQDLERQLTFFVRRLDYIAGDSADMMMADASINIESLLRGLVGFANLIDLGDDNIVVVLELGPDADNVPSADGAIISSSVTYGMSDMSDDSEAMDEDADDMSDDSEDMDEDADDMSDDSESMDAETHPTILGLALATENLSTLTEAVVTARVFSVLNGEGSLTVFAPTNDAFAALESGVDELDREALAGVLNYHIVNDVLFSSDLEDGQEIETLNGEVLTVGVLDDGVTLTDASGASYNVVTADVMASNGVVHIIDGVLSPSAGE